jgi:hypothetical protein
MVAPVLRGGKPKDVCAAIETALAICREPGFRQRMTGMLAEVVGTGDVASGDFLAAERAKWGRLITDLGIKVGGN